MSKADQELIADIRAGSVGQFDTLMKRYQDMVFKIAFGFTRDNENALDLSQDIFTKVYQNLGRLKDGKRFKPWLTKIAYREGISYMRTHKHNVNRQTFDETAYVAVSDRDEEFVKLHKSLLIRSLFNLSTRYRLAVVLRYFENMSIREIARTMQTSEGMVKNLLFRSICRLKEDVTEQYDEKM